MKKNFCIAEGELVMGMTFYGPYTEDEAQSKVEGEHSKPRFLLEIDEDNDTYDEDAEELFIIVLGNIVDGNRILGYYDSIEAAIECSESRDEQWQVAQLHKE